MYGELQDVPTSTTATARPTKSSRPANSRPPRHFTQEVQSETTAAAGIEIQRRHRHREEVQQQQQQQQRERCQKPEDAPHCVTCYCLPSAMKCTSRRTVTCGYERCPTTAVDYNNSSGDYCVVRPTADSKSKSGGRSWRKDETAHTTTVEELLREMELRAVSRSSMMEEEEDESEKIFESEKKGRVDCRAEIENDRATDLASSRTASSPPRHQHQQQQRHRRHRPSGAFSYRLRCQQPPAKLAETSARNDNNNSNSSDGDEATRIRSCERWPVPERTSQLRREDESVVIPPIEHIDTDASANDRKSALRTSKPCGFTNSVTHRTTRMDDCQQQQQQQQHQQRTVRNSAALLGAGDLEPTMSLTADKKNPAVASEPESDNDDDDDDDDADAAGSATSLVPQNEFSEAHVRELKLVRWEFIERIREEVHKLRRLQRHLDHCSPRGPRVAHTRSVSTMTSARVRGEGERKGSAARDT